MKTICLALVMTFAVASPGAALILSGTGTAVIDGVIDNVEWAGADAPIFQIDKPGGGTVNGSLFVMNDATNLYIALVVVYLDGGIDLSVEFDASGDGETLGAGDDDIGFNTSSGTARDGYRTASTAPSDTSGGGTLDVIGAWSTTAVSTYIEISHPLDSGDVGHDIAVGPSELLPFFAQIRLAPGSVDTFYPGPSAGIEAQIEIVPEPGAGASAALALLGVVTLRSRSAAATARRRSGRRGRS